MQPHRLLRLVLITLLAAPVQAQMPSAPVTKEANAQALYERGLQALQGKGQEADSTEAFNLFSRAADLGSAEAQFEIGALYQKRDKLAEAVASYERAAQMGSLRAMLLLQRWLEEGTVIQRDDFLSVYWLRRSIGAQLQQGQQGQQAEAAAHLNHLVDLFYDSRGVYVSEAEPLQWFKDEAGAGSAAAQYQLGLRLFFGWGLSANTAEATFWLLQAAEREYEPALGFLRWAYLNSDGKADAGSGNASFDSEWLSRGMAQRDSVPARALIAPGAQTLVRTALPAYLDSAMADKVREERRARIASASSVPLTGLQAMLPKLGALAKYARLSSDTVQRAAQAGNASAQTQLALAQRFGWALPLNADAACAGFARAAAQGHALAQAQLAQMLREGLAACAAELSEPERERQAREWIARAASGGSLLGMALQGLVRLEQEGGSEEGLALLQKSAERGNAFAQRQMGLLVSGLAPEKGGVARNIARATDAKQALLWLQRAAESEDVPALRALAAITDHGAAAEDLAQRFHWLTRAAGLGDAASQKELAQFYLSGVIRGQNQLLAQDWLLAAARQNDAAALQMLSETLPPMPIKKDELQSLADSGDARAQYQLGLNWRLDLARGSLALLTAMSLEDWRSALADAALPDVAQMPYLGSKIKEAQALDWLRRAAGQDEARAKLALALQYLTGLSGVTDDLLALRWAVAATQQGDAYAQFFLGVAFAKPLLDLPKNDAVALSWFQAAAWQGVSTAQCQMAIRLLSGKGVAPNYAQAAQWLLRSLRSRSVPVPSLSLAGGCG